VTPEPAPRQIEPEPFWRLQDLALFAGLALPCFLAGALAARALAWLAGLDQKRRALALIPGQFLGYVLLFAALGYVFRATYGRPFWKSLRWVRPAIPPATAAALGCLLAIVTALLAALLRIPDTQTPMKELLSDRTSLLVVLLFGVTLGPLCEELAFRGVIQPVLARALGPAAGIVLQGLAFGALHLPQYGNSWRHGLLIALAGSAFGTVRHFSGSTVASTWMHCAYNMTLFAGFLAGGKDVPQGW
jgi:membrane protease YdiL (CAAX protease family)